MYQKHILKARKITLKMLEHTIILLDERCKCKDLLDMTKTRAFETFIRFVLATLEDAYVRYNLLPKNLIKEIFFLQ